MLLREILRGYSWSILDATASIERAVQTIRQGQAFLLIVDDTPQMPLVRQLRYQLSDPVGALTPVLGFLLETHRHETAAIQHMGRPQVVDKPLTPSKFVPGFVNLVRTWEREPFVSLRRANYQFLSGNDAAGLRLLVKLTELEQTQHFAAIAIASHLRRMGKIKQAESILLAMLKKSPRELGTMTALADLYMHAAMPKVAHRLLSSARATYSQSMSMMPDMVQASLLMGNMSDAIACLYIMHKAAFMEPETSDFLARLLFAEGRESEAEHVLSTNKNALKRIQAGWSASEAVPASAIAPAV